MSREEDRVEELGRILDEATLVFDLANAAYKKAKDDAKKSPAEEAFTRSISVHHDSIKADKIWMFHAGVVWLADRLEQNGSWGLWPHATMDLVDRYRKEGKS